MNPHPANGRTYASPVWTPIRLSLAEDMWKRGKPPEDIVGAVNKLPGVPLSNANSLRTKAGLMGWLRPRAEKVIARRKPVARPTAPIPEPVPAPPAAATPVPMPEAPLAPAPVAMSELAMPPASPVALNCITGDRAEAEALIRGGMPGREVAAELDLPLGLVARWVGELRDRGEIP